MPVAVRKAANRWRPNSETSACTGCGRPFGLLVRRHHCRQCGDIFCAECSDHRRIVPIVHPTEPQRVCKKCDRYAAEAGSALRNGSIRLTTTSPLPYPDSGSNPSNSRLSEENEYVVRKASVISHSQEQIIGTARSADGGRPRGPGGATLSGSIGQSDARGLLDRNGSVASRSVASPTTSPNDACGRAASSISPLAPPLVATTDHTHNAASHHNSPGSGSAPGALQSSQLLNSEGPLDAGDAVEDDEADEFGLTGTPPSISPSLKEVGGNGSMSAGAALSFMAALEDATRVRQLTLPVLLYVREGHELPIVVPVDGDENVDAMVSRLTPKFFELGNVRKKAKPSELEALRKTLCFVNEQGIVIPGDLPCAVLSRRGERVVLATADAILSYKRVGSHINSGSNRSRHSGFFHRSERSDPGNDAPEFEDE